MVKCLTFQLSSLLSVNFDFWLVINPDLLAFNACHYTDYSLELRRIGRLFLKDKYYDGIMIHSVCREMV